jgi:branched-chain amino acid transport system ATP-binding protein
MPQARDLLTAAAALAVLPFALASIGLGVTSATEVVVFAIACMALNILVGCTGLTSSATAPGSGWPPMGRD